MSVMLCTRATIVKKISYLVARIVSFGTAQLDLLTFHILEPYPSKDIELDSVTLLTLMMLLQYPPTKSYLNQYFQVSQLQKYDGIIVITETIFRVMQCWKCGHLQITSHGLKLVSAIFYQIFIFSPKDSPYKTMKNVFYFI